MRNFKPVPIIRFRRTKWETESLTSQVHKYKTINETRNLPLQQLPIKNHGEPASKTSVNKRQM